jgi:hypothetical protein
MKQTADLIQKKIKLIRADLQLTKTFLTMANIERELNNNNHLKQLKGHIRKALGTVNKTLSDSRILIPEDEAAQITTELITCQTAFKAPKASAVRNSQGGHKILLTPGQEPQGVSNRSVFAQ